jgi:RNA polymerase sigma-70 factor (ECF subfamily)
MPPAFMGQTERNRGAVAERQPQGAGATTFEAFFSDQHARFLRALYLLYGDAGEAEDLMQDAFCKVWERWDRVARMDNPEGYLFRTGMNLWRSRTRRAVRTARRMVLPRRPESQDPSSAVDDHDVVMRALAQLAPRQRAAIVVTELLEYPPTEAAGLLGIRPSTVRALTSQGRAAMKRYLEVGDE